MAIMKICIIGRHGFIGSALAKRLVGLGHNVISYPTKDTDIVFNFGSPVHGPFEENVDYYMRETIDKHLFLLSFCRDNDIYYVWPSSALVYEPEKDLAFRRCKLAMEDLQFAYTTKTLGLRIFPVYGPGETRTAIYQWCKSASQNQPIEIYGDGTQERDFIYIDDVIDQILSLIEVRTVGICDIGAGQPMSFNDIANIVKTTFKDVEIKYLPAPKDYSKGVVCKNPLPINISMIKGINNIIKSL